MPLFKELKELKAQLKYYEDKVPVNNMGKWSRSVAIESYKNKIAKVEKKIAELKKSKDGN
jgi:prefoldin subunit 5